MTPPRNTIIQGDCLEVIKQMDDNSIDAIVTDPPYGLSNHKPQDVKDCLRAWLEDKPYTTNKKGFMGKTWDGWVPGPEVWKECLRVLKPGGHMLVFAGTRSMDLMSMAVRLSGFELRDSIGWTHSDSDSAPLLAWVYGSGFPKSLGVSKAIDKAAGAEREVVGSNLVPVDLTITGFRENAKSGVSTVASGKPNYEVSLTTPATAEAKQWQGWGTALKPSWEPLICARKPLEGTVAQNVLKHGTGALNIDGCRVAINNAVDDPRLGGAGTWSTDKMAKNVYEGKYSGERIRSSRLGRWPANLILTYPEDEYDETGKLLPNPARDEVTGLFPETKKAGNIEESDMSGGTSVFGIVQRKVNPAIPGDKGGSAARFFYTAKSSKSDREEGLEGLPSRDGGHYAQDEWSRQNMGNTPDAKREPRRNHHPTVKPTKLMQYLCRLVTPPGGLILDPFTGSGSTGKGAVKEGFRFIGIELDPEYCHIARARIKAVIKDET
jgi:DNA modification methylase